MPAGKKSRTGCTRCKEKRLKCDETRPACSRCIRAREICPGYQRPIRWSGKHERWPCVRYTSRSEPAEGGSSRDVASIQGSSSSNSRDGTHYSAQLTSMDFNMSRSSKPDADIDQLGIYYQSPHLPDMIPWSDVSTGDNNIIHSVFIDSEVQGERLLSPSIRDTEVARYSAIEQDGMLDELGRFQLQSFGDPREDTITNSVSVQMQRTCDEIWPIIIQPQYALVEYYFKEVATIYSCYDGDMNPFRSIIARLWTSSANIAKTLQSMAAACLAPVYPHLAKEGFKLRQELFRSTCAESNAEDSPCITLLITIMLGQTAGWHNPQDLGLIYYRRSKELLRSLEADDTVLQHSVVGKDITFFQNAVGYWETLFAFVLPKEELYPPTKLSIQAEPSLLLIDPHPWALAAPELMAIIRQVGQLVWGDRSMHSRTTFWRRIDSLNIAKAIDEGIHLERCLLDFELPTESGLIDPRDETTPLSHLLLVSQAYRLVALMMLYRVFPDVLVDRMRATQLPEVLSHCFTLQTMANLDPQSEHDRDILIKELAFYALGMIESIPLESHTRCVQPFLLLALSCEVGQLNSSSFDDSTHATTQARSFIQNRLDAFRHYLPPKPAQCRLDLVREVWRCLDRGKGSAFWIDIVIGNGWQFLFG